MPTRDSGIVRHTDFWASQIDRKIGNLTALRTELDRVIGSCRHGMVADCKIIEALAPRRIIPV